MDEQYWKERWKNSETLFHKTQAHPMLVKHASLLPIGKTIVPLCGKSMEMLYLSRLGHEIVGIELSPIACESFFKENNLHFQKISDGKSDVYRGGNISIWCGNFFDVPEKTWDGMTGIYDRAALVALPPEMRKEYAKTILNHISKNASFETMLLISFDYPQSLVEGPPFSVPLAEIKTLYGSALDILTLEGFTDQNISSRREQFRNVEVLESIYSLNMKRK